MGWKQHNNLVRALTLTQCDSPLKNPGKAPVFYKINRSYSKKKTASGQVIHTARAYPGFCHMEWLGVSLLPPGWGEALRVKRLAQEHNVMTQANPDFLMESPVC